MNWITGAFFLTVMLSTMAAGYLLVLGRRKAEEGASLPDGEQNAKSVLSRTLNQIGKAIPDPTGNQAPLRTRLLMAGYRWPSAPTMFHGIRIASGLGLAGITGWSILFWHGGTASTVVPFLAAAGFGYLLPDRVLEARIRARAQRIRRGISAALDLLVLALEAGQSLDQAVQEVAKALASSFPDLADEFLFCRLEMRAGKSRQEALRRLMDRSADSELRKLAALMIDAERFGTSLGPALRTHSRYLRMRIRHQAQEAARKLGVKLTLPIFFLIFPVVLLVTVGPAILRFSESLKNLFGGL
jgi:tight adherence protein C